MGFGLAYLIGQAVVVVTYLAGVLAGTSAMGFAIVPIVVSVGFNVNMWLLRKGVARLTPTRLEVRTRGGRHLYAWSDIADVRIRRLDQMWLPDRLWLKICGIDTDREIVELGLRRSIRFGLVPFRYGTDIIGPPTPFSRTVRLFVTDPHGFASAAKKWVPESVSPS